MLILDDYSMGLDAGYRRLFLDYLIDYTRGDGKTIFITSHIIQDLENFLEDCVILDYRSVLLNMPVKKFQEEFKHFRFITNNPDLKLSRNNIIRNFEIIRNTASIYTFATQSEIIEYLKKEGVQFSDLGEVKMSLEDAFIGITGKY